IHLDSAFYDVDSFRNGERPIRILDYEREEVGDVTGKTLLHLQCHFALDTLSWARLGATVTGADFSTEAIAAARSLASEVGSPAACSTSRRAIRWPWRSRMKAWSRANSDCSTRTGPTGNRYR